MSTVRHNGRSLDPAPYERGFGVSSVIIRVANWLRIRLERFVAERILRLAGKPKQTAYPTQVPAPSPRPAKEKLRELFYELPEGTPFTRADRYRRDAEANQLLPVDESPMLKRALAHAMRHTDRSVRYYTARGTKILIPEDMFMPVENDISEIPAPSPTSGDTVDDALRRLREDAALKNLRNADFNLGRSERYLSVPGGLPKIPRNR